MIKIKGRISEVSSYLFLGLVIANTAAFVVAFIWALSGEFNFKKPMVRAEAPICIGEYGGAHTAHGMLVGIKHSVEWLGQPAFRQPKPADPKHPEADTPKSASVHDDSGAAMVNAATGVMLIQSSNAGMNTASGL